MSRFILCALLAAALAAVAQTSPRPDPLDARAAVPPAVYRSPLAGYRGAGTPASAVGWKQANDEVARIGGWRAYAREAAASEPAASHKH